MICFSGTDRDITERIEMEKALVKAKNELEQRVSERTAELETKIDDLERTGEALNKSEQRYQALRVGSWLSQSWCRNAILL